MKNVEYIEHYFESTDKDLIVAKNLFSSGHYLWCLFIGHLILEKTMKGLYIKENRELPPKIHDLVRLARASNIVMDKNLKCFIGLLHRLILKQGMMI